jgi:serine protease AprX
MNSRRLVPAGLAVCALVIAAPRVFASSPSDDQKIDRALLAALKNGAPTQPVIVTVKPGYRSDLRDALRRHGDRIKSEHPSIDALAVELHTADVRELAKQPGVEAVSFDAPVFATASTDLKGGTTSPTVLTTQPAQQLSGTLRETLGLPRVATAGTMTGATGVGVAIIDSGIAPSDDFLGRITGFYDFTRGGVATAPYDEYGHGTHVAGLIGSSGKLSNYQYQGVAPDVHLVGLKVLDATGAGKTSDVINALEFVVANKSHLNVHIVNLSLGHPIYAPAKDDPLVQAVEKATAAGLIVVASAGNFGESKSGKTATPGSRRRATRRRPSRWAPR